MKTFFHQAWIFLLFLCLMVKDPGLLIALALWFSLPNHGKRDFLDALKPDPPDET